MTTGRINQVAIFVLSPTYNPPLFGNFLYERKYQKEKNNTRQRVHIQHKRCFSHCRAISLAPNKNNNVLQENSIFSRPIQQTQSPLNPQSTTTLLINFYSVRLNCSPPASNFVCTAESLSEPNVESQVGWLSILLTFATNGTVQNKSQYYAAIYCNICHSSHIR